MVNGVPMIFIKDLTNLGRYKFGSLSVLSTLNERVSAPIPTTILYSLFSLFVQSKEMI
jgi:hypothetical protein